MSIANVQQVIGRATTEPEFRALLFRDPSQALADYELSEAEAASLRQLSPETFDFVVSDLEVRVSRSAIATDSVTNLSKSGSDSQKASIP